jgi:hypothetical protein
MAAFDFPDSPVVDQVYKANGASFFFNGTLWKRTPSEIKPAGTTADETGVVYVVPGRGLALDSFDGQLALQPAGSQSLGGIFEPTDPTGQVVFGRRFGQWVETAGATSSDSPPPNPTANQLWFDSDSGNFFIWFEDVDSGQWVQINAAGGSGSAAAFTYGDVKSCLQTADHGGWVLLDGRAVTALTATQQTIAAGLGLAANLPNATDCVMLQNGGVPGTVSGSWAIAVANLPAHNMTTGSAGDHEHLMPLGQGGVNCTSYEVTAGSANWSWDAAIGNTGGAAYTATGNFMNTGGAHTHSIALGGGGQALEPKQMAANMFVYLGS